MKYLRCIHPDYGNEPFWADCDGDELDVCDGHILTGLQATGRRLDAGAVERYLPPVDPPNVFAVGANYIEHCRETNATPPSLPLVFIKATSSVTAHEQPILLPSGHPDEVDYEAELAVVIGRPAKGVKAENALDYVLGYTCAHDVSARDVQKRIDRQWARAKSFDTFCPLGPFLETAFDPSDVRVRLRLNGEEMQNQSTADMTFDVGRIIEFISADITLAPGTVILTGTPSGVGFSRQPPVFLCDGDVAEVDVEGLGVLRNRVRKQG